MLNKKLLTGIILIFCSIKIFGQVSISDDMSDEAHPSAVLELVSDNKGFLLPRMGTDERNSIDDAAKSLLIYNLDSKCVEVYIVDEWNELWCAPVTHGCEGVEGGVEYEGYTYDVVEIGDQCWFKENLNVGTRINNEEDQGVDCDNIEKYCYDNDEDNCDIYGGLYQWDQAMCGATTGRSQGICPDGWYVPNHHDWRILENYICEEAGHDNCEEEFPFDWSTTGWSGTDEGAYLADNASLWEAGNLTSNPNFGESGFFAIPGGRRFWNSDFHGIETNANLWTSSQSGDDAWRRGLHKDNLQVNVTRSQKTHGASVRCLRE